MNAGAYDGEMANGEKVLVVDMDANLFEMQRDELEYGYREHFPKGNKILLEVEMELIWEL